MSQMIDFMHFNHIFPINGKFCLSTIQVSSLLEDNNFAFVMIELQIIPPCKAIAYL